MYDPCEMETWYRSLTTYLGVVIFILAWALILALQSAAHQRSLHRQAREALRARDRRQDQVSPWDESA